MQRREAIGVLGMAAFQRVGTQPSGRGRFAGAYKLISYERKTASGEVIQVYGPAPIGRITYDKAGRMSAFLMRPGRKAPQDARALTLEELREIQSGFIAYMGTFDVDEATKTVVHHVVAALNPNWPGTDLKRNYEFSANRLTLTVAGTPTVTLVWERETD